MSSIWSRLLNNKYLRIGQIVRAHGIRGDVKLVATTDDIHRFDELIEVYLEQDEDFWIVQLSDVRIQPPGSVILHIRGIDSPEDAQRLKYGYLCVDRTQAIELPPGSWFIADLIGCETLDSSGRTLGCLTDVIKTGANDVYEIEHGKLLVPALKKVLHSVDVTNKRIVFDAEVLQEVGLFAY